MIDFDEVHEVLRMIHESGGCDLEVETPGFRLAVSRIASAPREAGVGLVAAGNMIGDGRGAGPAVASRPPVATAEVAASESDTGQCAVGGGILVRSPSVGVFYAAPAPGKAPYAKVGMNVAEGDTLGQIEVMKVFIAVPAPASGRVVRVLVSNGSAVEYEEPLFEIEP